MWGNVNGQYHKSGNYLYGADNSEKSQRHRKK